MTFEQIVWSAGVLFVVALSLYLSLRPSGRGRGGR